MRMLIEYVGDLAVDEEMVKTDTDRAKLETDIADVWARMKASCVEFDLMKANSLLNCLQLRFDILKDKQ